MGRESQGAGGANRPATLFHEPQRSVHDLVPTWFNQSKAASGSANGAASDWYPVVRQSEIQQDQNALLGTVGWLEEESGHRIAKIRATGAKETRMTSLLW